MKEKQILSKIFEAEDELKIIELEKTSKKLYEILKFNENVLLRDAYIFTNASVSFYNNFKIDEAFEIIKPLFNKIAKKEEWHFTDLNFFARIIKLAQNYKEAINLAHDALKALEYHKNYEYYNKLKTLILINIMLRTLHEKNEKTSIYFEKHIDESITKSVVYLNDINTQKICLIKALYYRDSLWKDEILKYVKSNYINIYAIFEKMANEYE